jgi:hypothetical protein
MGSKPVSTIFKIKELGPMAGLFYFVGSSSGGWQRSTPPLGKREEDTALRFLPKNLGKNSSGERVHGKAMMAFPHAEPKAQRPGGPRPTEGPSEFPPLPPIDPPRIFSRRGRAVSYLPNLGRDTIAELEFITSGKWPGRRVDQRATVCGGSFESQAAQR